VKRFYEKLEYFSIGSVAEKYSITSILLILHLFEKRIQTKCSYCKSAVIIMRRDEKKGQSSEVIAHLLTQHVRKVFSFKSPTN